MTNSQLLYLDIAHAAEFERGLCDERRKYTEGEARKLLDNTFINKYISTYRECKQCGFYHTEPMAVNFK